VDYFPEANGAAPDDGSPITLQVLGSDGNGGVFGVDALHDPEGMHDAVLAVSFCLAGVGLNGNLDRCFES